MSASIRQIHSAFVSEVDGIDLREPLDSEDVAAIEEGMDRYTALIFHDQAVPDEQQIVFSRNFGTLEQAVGETLSWTPKSRTPTDE